MPTLEQQLAAARESHRQKILDSYTSHLAALPEETRIVGSDPQSVFLYGTLMHPSVLRRVIQGAQDGVTLEVAPACLTCYARYRVKECDYPAIVPSLDDSNVEGIVVRGLTPAHMYLLDNFEDEEYTRERVSVRPLNEFTALSASHSKSEQQADRTEAISSEEISAWTYVWKGDRSRLLFEPWSFGEFVRSGSLSFWVGNSMNLNA